MSSVKPVRVRFAPSPTGRTHLGSGRTALFNYLIARQSGGQFILRIEDTDQKRYVPGAEEELIESLHWLGLDWDEGPDVGGPHSPYHQSKRKSIYLDHARWLVDHGHAYYCFCSVKRLEMVRQNQIKSGQTPRYDGFCRKLSIIESANRVRDGETHVIRFKMPREGSITSRDLIRGNIVVENRNLDDYIIVKSDGLALYHLAAMVDDHLMGISHVIRGSEWLSTFPLHTHIIHAFGWQAPEFVHLSVFLKPSGKGKMSKREASDLSDEGYSIFISDIRDLGYLPEAVVNWISLMGWSYDDRTELFTISDLIAKFSLARLNPAPAAINFSKLDHFNGLHIRQLSTDDLAERMKPFLVSAGIEVDDQLLKKTAPLVKERIVSLDEAAEWLDFFFRDNVTPKPNELIGKNMTLADSEKAAKRAHQILSKVPEFKSEDIEPVLRDLAQDLGLKAGQLFGILRVAVTGRIVSPPLLESMEILGRDRVLERLQNAVNLLGQFDHP